MYELINSKKLFWTTIGKGESIVILHGGLGFDHRYLKHWLKPISQNFKLYFIDLPGNGKSSKFKKYEHFSPEIVINQLEIFRKKRIGKKIHIIGHSYGGWLSLIYSLLYPSVLNKIILLSPALSSNCFNQAAIKKKLKMLSLKAQTIAADENLLKTNKHFKDYMSELNALYFFSRKMQKIYEKYNKSKYNLIMYKRSIEILINNVDSYKDKYKHIKKPILLIKGMRDIITKPNSTISIETNPCCIAKRYNKSGHFPFVEEQIKCLSDINDFLLNNS